MSLSPFDDRDNGRRADPPPPGRAVAVAVVFFADSAPRLRAKKQYSSFWLTVERDPLVAAKFIAAALMTVVTAHDPKARKKDKHLKKLSDLELARLVDGLNNAVKVRRRRARLPPLAPQRHTPPQKRTARAPPHSLVAERCIKGGARRLSRAPLAFATRLRSISRVARDR